MRRLLIFILFLLSPIVSKPCDCEEKYFIGSDKAKHVFRGTVESIKRIYTPFRRFEVTFLVAEWEKGGSDAERMTVNVNCLNEGCCGYEFDFYNEYRVCTYMKDTLVYTGFCTGTHKVKD
jgi:hypothetical protein